MDYEISFNNVIKLATRLQRHVVIFDLECTTFRGSPDFGITEVAAFTVAPNGPGVIYSHLINPERKISAKVSELTGITQDMVSDKELWGARYADHFLTIADNYWVTGFNNKTFDLPAVRDMNERYGKPIAEFKYVFDVRTLHLDLAVAESKKGTLTEISRLYGVEPKGNTHRAKADVILTVELLDAIIDVYGLDAVLERILPKQTGAYDKLTAQSIAKFAKGKPTVSLASLATAFKTDEKKAGYELGRAIDELLVDPAVFGAADTQHWLCEALMEVETNLVVEGKLKPLYERLQEVKPEGIALDYVQLRVALHTAGIKWSSLKPS